MAFKNSNLKAIVDILLDFKGEKIIEYCSQKLSQAADPYSILTELSRGLDEIGKGYENKDFKRYFTSDLIVSGRNMKKAVEAIEPHIQKKNRKSKGLVIVGTVAGDVHDIGKMIFAITLESNGFTVIDLGVDVSNDAFIDKVKQLHPDILAVSSLLTSTLSSMEELIQELKKEKLRKKIKIIIGGRAVTEEFAKKITVDAYGKDAIDGLKKCLAVMEALQ